jgi:sialate O-acetylesterase
MMKNRYGAWIGRTGGALLLMGVFSLASATVSVSRLFASHMVFQRNMVNPVWGRAASGEQVSVTIGTQTQTVTTPASGKWRVLLDSMAAAGPLTMTIKGTNTLTLTDVYIGEVWQVGGQSNMDTRLNYYPNLADSILAANVPLLRYITLRQPTQANSTWNVVTPTTATILSATGYFFGKQLQSTLGIAVGLVVTAVGGTTIDQWLDSATIAQNPGIIDTSKGDMWRAWVDSVVGFGIKGTVWIQGEQNCTDSLSENYGSRFQLLINGWRAAWGEGTFPFIFGQLSNTNALQVTPNDTGWIAPVRDGQRLGLELPNTAMAVFIDIGSDTTWHFPNKPEAGRRLSLPAKALLYGQTSLVYSGPLYQSMTISGNTVKLVFSQIGSGLTPATGAKSLTGFTVAGATGATGKWYWATSATISGDTVLVSSDSVSVPTRVRYAWADNPICNLYNIEGLPAAAFSTETAPLITAVRSPGKPRPVKPTARLRTGQAAKAALRVNALGRAVQSATASQCLLDKTGGKQVHMATQAAGN